MMAACWALNLMETKPNKNWRYFWREQATVKNTSLYRNTVMPTLCHNFSSTPPRSQPQSLPLPHPPKTLRGRQKLFQIREDTSVCVCSPVSPQYSRHLKSLRYATWIFFFFMSKGKRTSPTFELYIVIKSSIPPIHEEKTPTHTQKWKSQHFKLNFCEIHRRKRT